MTSAGDGGRRVLRATDDGDDPAHAAAEAPWERVRRAPLLIALGDRDPDESRARAPGSSRRLSRWPGQPPQRARATSASRSATPRAVACVSASTITRTSGSVPLGRTSTRPAAAEGGLLGRDLGGHGLGDVGPALGDPHVHQHLRAAGS